MDWYYMFAADQRGPVSSQALVSMITSGELHSSVLVWSDGMNDFVPAADVPDLASLIAAALAPPAPSEPALDSGEPDQMKIARQTYRDLLDMAVVDGAISPRQGEMLAVKKHALGLSPTDPEILGMETELLGTTLDAHHAEQSDSARSSAADAVSATLDGEHESTGEPQSLPVAVPELKHHLSPESAAVREDEATVAASPLVPARTAELPVTTARSDTSKPAATGEVRPSSSAKTEAVGKPQSTTTKYVLQKPMKDGNKGCISQMAHGCVWAFLIAFLIAFLAAVIIVSILENDAGAARSEQEQLAVNPLVAVPTVAQAPTPTAVQTPVPTPPVVPARSAWRQGSKAGELLTLEVASGVEMAFRWCPAGSFVMGSPASEKEILSKAGMEENSYSAETPHEVRLTEGYWLAETEVTQGQWQVVMGTSLIDQANKALAGDEEYEIGGKKQTLRDIYKMKSGDGAKIIGVVYDRIAMYWISWHEAEDYCNKVSRVVETKGWGLMARLPSEAQWEYACRAGTSKMTYMADFAINSTNNAPGLDPMAWYGGNSSWGYEGQGWDTSGWPEMQYAGGNAGPRRVGQKQANGGGLQDMLGNVWEWCADWYGVYPANATSDPQGNPTGTYRINRGGSWDSPAAACRAAARNWCVPGFRSYNMGFRPVLIPSG